MITYRLKQSAIRNNLCKEAYKCLGDIKEFVAFMKLGKQILTEKGMRKAFAEGYTCFMTPKHLEWDNLFYPHNKFKVKIMDNKGHVLYVVDGKDIKW